MTKIDTTEIRNLDFNALSIRELEGKIHMLCDAYDEAIDKNDKLNEAMIKICELHIKAHIVDHKLNNLVKKMSKPVFNLHTCHDPECDLWFREAEKALKEIERLEGEES